MAPPVAAIVIGVVAGAAAVYVVKEAWEPHIKPELQKASLAAKSWWERTSRRAAQARAVPLFQRRQRKPSPSSDDTSDDHSALERLVGDVIHEWGKEGSGLKRRQPHSSAGDVEMMEIDKSNAFIPQIPISPSAVESSRSQSSETHSSSSNDPFADLVSEQMSKTTETGLETPPTSPHKNPAQGLLLSFPSLQSTSLAPDHINPTRAALDVPANERSPWSQSSSLSASAFSWTDGAASDRGEIEEEDAEDIRAFTFGTMENMSSASLDSDRHSDPGFERDIESPTHHSSSESGGSPNAAHSIGSWESVGSPSSDSSRVLRSF